jgi:hypothetical protein
MPTGPSVVRFIHNAEKKQLRLRVANPQAHVGDVEEKAQVGVEKTTSGREASG